ncbi:MAG: amidohydrolase [Lachnospiraceae bacterium]|nr:amidohydrolase [Lachnospiraceae bacterium]
MNKYHDKMAALSDQIWDYAELKFAEHKSAKVMVDFLKEEGFEVETGIGEIETAYMAKFGQGKPVIGILGEFDALSGMSQMADVAEKTPREGTNNGHGCGHHLLGVAGIGAAMILRDYFKETGKEGTVVFYGCPGEEGGSGKAYMARAGVFNICDIIYSWHPGGANGVMTGSYQANCQVYFKFHGTTAHAAGSPHLGRSALDAVELMNVGVNYMREHMESTDRIHYAVLDTGGISPNVVQANATVLYLIRSISTEKVLALYERVQKIAKGAALMTETEVEIIFDKGCSNVVPNGVLEQVLYESMQRVGVPEYTEEELAYAQQYTNTFSDAQFAAELGISGTGCSKKSKEATTKKVREEGPMHTFVAPHEHSDANMMGSTDVGDASYCAPTAQFIAATYAFGTPAHSWQMVAQGKSSVAHKGQTYAAEIIADAAIQAIENPEIIEKAKAEFNEATGGKPYQCPIPADVKPAASRM